MTIKTGNNFDLTQILFLITIFTSSFDIFLVLNLGVNIRISQVTAMLFIGLVLLNFRRNIIYPLSFGWLVLWVVFIIAFTFNSSFLVLNISYTLWLLFNVFLVLACVRFYSIKNIINLIRWYIYSFVFVAAFGVIQFFSPLLGLGDFLLIQQWWIDGVLPRINGFSYEPSYFATYLILGWVICAYLTKTKSNLFVSSNLKLYFFVITGAIILSSSRLGILVIFVWYCQYPFMLIRDLCNGYVRKKLVKLNFIFLIGVLLIGFFVSNLIESDYSFLLNGTGLADTASHSVDDRYSGFQDTISLFMDSPYIGRGLAGIPVGIAESYGETNINFDTVKQYSGFSVFAEVLAASGIFGFIPFAVYIISIIYKPYRLAREVSSEQADIIVALTLSLVFELFILQFNQNILRPYLWIHIGVLSACYSAFVRRGNKLNYLSVLSEVTN